MEKEFSEKYVSVKESEAGEKRIIISNDAYAIGEQLEKFIKELKRQAMK